MDNKENFLEQSMDDIIFDKRNKNYGAYVIRENYQKHLLKAIGISFGLFVFGLYSPKMANAMGLFKEKPKDIEQIDTLIYLPPTEPVDVVKPHIEPQYTPPEPSATQKFNTMKPVRPEEADRDPLVINDSLTNIGTTTTQGPDNKDPLLFDPGDGPTKTLIIETPAVVNVDQSPEFIGGTEALEAFLKSVLIYPLDEQLLGVEGETIVSFIVAIDGRVEDVKVARTSGNAHLDSEAVNAMKKSSKKFKAGKVRGKSVRSVCQIPITFELEDAD